MNRASFKKLKMLCPLPSALRFLPAGLAFLLPLFLSQGISLDFQEPFGPSVSCNPESAFLPLKEDQTTLESLFPTPSRLFCQTWKMDFTSNASECCSPPPRLARARGRQRAQCAPHRRPAHYCGEVTPEQKAFTEKVQSGKIPNLLQFYENRLLDRRFVNRQQSYCGDNNGFLAFGQPVVETPDNRLHIKNKHRCLNFATDGLGGLLEWLGRELGQAYPASKHSGVLLMLGDISAPKGGCIHGVSQSRAHASHTSGRDADIGFIQPRAKHSLPQSYFEPHFDPPSNWWFLKKVFHNPFVCVKMVLLEKNLIRRLRSEAKKDPEWRTLSQFIRPDRHERRHYHIRVGSGPGAPGCKALPGSLDQEVEGEEELDGADAATSQLALPALKAGGA